MEKTEFEALLGGNIVLTQYSGRGMFGRQCVSIYGDSVQDVMADLVECAAEKADPVDLASLIRSARTDDMGRGVVVYWPDIAWVD